MTDIGIFILGCCVFGVALAATMAATIGTSQSRTGEREIFKMNERESTPRQNKKRVMRGSR